MKNHGQRIGAVAAGLLLAFLFAVHFLHLSADFPNFSPWMDYAKYTDEGWYGNAAVAYFIRGGWYVPGDFNPAVALPVWPMLEWLLFHLTGVSLSAARALTVIIFGGNVVLTCLLVRRFASRRAATVAAVLLVSNAFLYCFSRVAILEPLLSFFMLLAWLMVLQLPQVMVFWQRAGLLTLIGLVLSGMVLTKTTAVFLFPAVGYLLWSCRSRQRRKDIISFSVVTASAGLSWSIYYLRFVRPHYLDDYHYLFTANVWPQPDTPWGWLMAFWYSLHGTLWIDPKFATVAGLLLVLSLVCCRETLLKPIVLASLLAIGGYLFFIGFHNNMQPRYYQVVAYPMVIFVASTIDLLVRQRSRVLQLAAMASWAAVAVAVVVNGKEMLYFAVHPEYTFVHAAENLTRYIDQHPNRNRLLLSISGSDIAFVTGLPAICDDFGTLELPDRIRKYQPGWYAAWNELDPGTLEDLHTQFNLEQVANFPAYDDEDRNNLILYKLIPLGEQSLATRRIQSRHAPFGAKAGKVQLRTVAGDRPVILGGKGRR